jgi:protease I
MSVKRVAVFVDQAYQELEVWYPLLRLKEAGVEVVTFGPSAGQIVTSKLGYPVKADRGYDQLNAADFDGVVVPGGWAPDYIRRRHEPVEFVAAMDRGGKLVAAVCHGPWVLCYADVLRGRRATGFFAIRTDMVNAGCLFEDAEVVIDGNLVTSRKPEDLPAFLRGCLQVLAA